MAMWIKLNQDPFTLVPNQTIEGTVRWHLTEAPRQAALRLFWYTEGRGTQDVGVVEELQLPADKTQLDGTFRFNIPDMPYSFKGSLITLKWAIELSLNKGKEVERLELVVSPWVEQVSLGKVE